MKPPDDYCSFTKAVEHLGDRWSLLIVREMATHRSLGFNALAETLPSISRSVLARRLRKLEELGIIERTGIERTGRAASARPAPHRLTPAGEQLVPTLMSLKSWAERWVPEDPAMVQRDPDVIMLWMTHRADPSTAPERRAVLEFEVGGPRAKKIWLVLERGALPSICFEDPSLPPERYVHVEADPTTLYPISRGLRTWGSAIADASVALYGDPGLVRAMPGWFRPEDSLPRSASATTPRKAPTLAVAG
jgi:DNA-binding HxlR family transcriptional regulator